jgi:hypothetical protein
MMIRVDMSPGLRFGSDVKFWFLYLCLVYPLFHQSGYFVMCLDTTVILDHTLGALVIWSDNVSVGSVFGLSICRSCCQYQLKTYWLCQTLCYALSVIYV